MLEKVGAFFIPAILVIISLICLYVLIFKILGLRIIGTSEVGIVEKWWSPKGNLKDGKFIALNGEAGFQPDVLRTGIHFKSCLIYKVEKCPLVTIPQGQIGYVFARDGEPLKETQTLGRVVECANYQDTRVFLANGGQKGPQRSILREGTYAFNLSAFIIFTEATDYYINIGNKLEAAQIKRMSDDLRAQGGFRPVVIKEGTVNVSGDVIKDPMGIVTVQDGPSLPNGEIIAPVVGQDPLDLETYHNNFQNTEAFLKAGGYRGKQYQVISDGTYFINRLFASIDIIPKTIIPVGFAGVVNSFVGKKGIDVTGSNYTHGELVEEGCKGIWANPLKPGKYSYNLSAGILTQVPTTNFILKWVQDEVGGHKFDENLKEVTLITRDAFEPTLPLSVVVHIDYKKAPLVIQRFGDIKRLVDQTLDPMVSSYFKNIGQTMTLIELIQNRSEIQKQATEEMKSKFQNYNLELEEVLIGTPSPNGDKKIEEILKQLSDRQLAKEKIETYNSQMKASEKEKELKEFQAKSEQQAELTKSEINIKIQDNVGKAELQKAKQDAERQKTLADAESYKVKRLGEAQAEMKARLGIAQAIATKEQVNAYGGPQYQVIQDVMSKFTDAIKEGKINIVPNNVVTMGGTENGGNVNAVESLLAVLLSEKIGVDFKINTEESDFAKKMKQDIYKKMSEEKTDYNVKPKEEIEVKEKVDNNVKSKDEIKEKPAKE
ncbi:MAG: flotillin family protein [Clostridium sp.]|uniref:SPFH domain-containing protein n=1 Tax=Clostridium sp. TaxID=1506 RepID=UPI0025B8461C|nr:SPFH domain-containing protein [Clostridium sp.]MCE5222081.1 flotillin family protein [Clostridium sp.]